MKKFFTLCLAIVASLSLLRAEVYEGECGEDLYWSLDSETGVLTITGTGAMTDFSYSSVPWTSSYVKSVEVGEGVKSIGTHAFYFCSNLTSVSLPSTLLSIGQYAFSYCSSLTSIAIPNSVTSIGYNAFKSCSGLTEITLPSNLEKLGNSAFASCRRIEKITIPSSITSIGTGTFQYCTGLKSVELSESLTSIGSYAFIGCKSLSSITFPNSLKNIETWAFAECDALTSVTIPRAVYTIGSFAFGHCNSLENIFVDEDSEYYQDIDGVLFDLDANTLIAYPTGKQAKEYTIPSGVSTINASAFEYCTNLQSVTIPTSVNKIGESAFSSCTYLSTVTIPNTVTSIGSYAFSNVHHIEYYGTATGSPWGAKSMNGIIVNNLIFSNEEKTTLVTCLPTASGEITIPSTVTTISDYAFNGCKDITRIIIPESVNSIGWSVFDGCSKLEAIDVNENNTNYLSKDGVLMKLGERMSILKMPEGFTGAYTVPEGVVSLECFSIDNVVGLTEITFPKSFDGGMCEEGLRNCPNLKKAVFTSCVSGGEYEWFFPEDCEVIAHSNLSIQLEDTTVCYGATVWDINCYYDQKISVVYTSVYGCDSTVWRNVKLDKVVGPHIEKQDIGETMLTGTITIYDGYAYIYSDGSSSDTTWADYDYIIMDGVRYDHAASHSKNEVYNTNTEGTHSARPSYTFENLSPGSHIFEFHQEGDCSVPYTTSEYIYKYGMLVDGIYYTFEDSVYDDTQYKYVSANNAIVTYKGKYASEYNEYSGDIVIPETVTFQDKEYVVKKIGREAFYYCDGLTSITLPEGLISIGSDAFKYCSGLTSITLPEGLISIESDVFNGCSGLTSIVFPKGLTNIGSYAFGYCSNLTSITLPEGLTSVSSYAFYGCYGLRSITLPEGITSIGSHAFASNKDAKMKLENIYIHASTPPSIYYNAFYNVSTEKVNLFVPIGCTESYKQNSTWNEFKVLSAINIIQESAPTSTIITLEEMYESDEIIACGIEGGELSEGKVLEYIGLEPNSTYEDIPIVVKTASGGEDITKISFTTTSLELTTLESKAASSTTAILLAETNISDAETNCGFEWKRHEQPSDMNPTKEYATVSNGIMAGRLKGLKDDVYYQYRAFYESATGKKYYGEWQYIFTGDAGVEFEPILYTEPAHVIRENEATLRGFALAGAEEITEQGFEYWVERRVNFASNETENGRNNMPADHYYGERYIVQADGVAMETTVTDLDAGTQYKFRVYAKAGGVTYYGGEQSFITKGAYNGHDSETAVENVENQETATKILRDGQILIHRDGKTYTVTGQVVK